ncbi:YtzH-like family protein [Caldibacillus lycopersici]|uniref:YtzH-like family protein n=1 Tax=Perspicuibacillus lycopersici TaxID=1325689 RepID=A0AAE3ITL1_9BACI|nr:YtzH-like family protein [Perspicuibacillus lycopersici]MCU9614251.1 YtzH-like family protein [Perspicuibacillus lycopersici]
MPINHTDQLNLLKDILQNHQEDCCGSVSECEQIERLVKSLMVNENVSTEAKSILNQVYSYGQSGKYTQDLNTHIESHQDQLSDWVDTIGQYS